MLTEVPQPTRIKWTMGNYWSEIQDYYKAFSPTYLNEVYEKALAESSDTKQAQMQVVNPVTLLTITTLEAALLLRNYANPTSTLRGWEKEAHAFLSGVSIYGPPVNLSSSPKEK
jgi:hypothetical protein